MSWAGYYQGGHRPMYGLTIEGIPHDFIEFAAPQAGDIADPAPSSSDRTVSESLWIDPATRLSIELDREHGIATASRFTFELNADRLGDLAPALFGAPTRRALLNEYIDDPDQDVFNFRDGDLDDWPESGHFHLGLEYCSFGARVGRTLIDIERGLAGRPHIHSSLGWHDGFTFAADRPQTWSGRLITLYEHLVSPQGHIVSEQYNTVATGCREVWCGYIDSLPVPTTAGFALGSIALVRRLAQRFGRVARGKTIFSDPRAGGGDQKVWITPSDTISVTVTRPSESNFTFTLPSAITDAFQSLHEWSYQAAVTLFNMVAEGDVPSGLFDSVAPLTVEWDKNPARFWLIIGANPDTGATYEVVPSTSWWRPGTYPMQYVPGKGWRVDLPWREVADQIGITVQLDRNTADEDVPDIPSDGVVRLRQGERVEIAGYRDATFTTFGDFWDGAIYLYERDLGRTGSRVDLFNEAEEVEITFLIGSVGTVRHNFLTLATSSGMGINGEWDTAPRQQGQYIPIGRIDTTSLLAYPMNRDRVPFVAEEATTLADMAGGWFALHGYCMGQRRGPDGVVRLTLERVQPANGDVLDSSHILMDGTEVSDPLQPPNEVSVARGVLGAERMEVVRDKPRIAVEGAQRYEFDAAGIGLDDAVDAAADFLRVQEGIQALTVATPLDTELQAGDPVDLRTAHPLVWSYRLGQRAPAEILGRALTWSRDLGVGNYHNLIVLEGLAPVPAYLCPASRILNVSGSVITLEEGAGSFYRQLEKVMAYLPRGGNLQIVDDIITAHATTSTYQGQHNDVEVHTASAVTMTHFSFSAATTGSINVKLYWRSGTCIGFLGSSSGWTLIHDATVALVAGETVKVALAAPIVLDAGLNGFYLTPPSPSPFIRYASGSHVETSNGDVGVWTRGVNAHSFGTVFNNFRGVFGIDYYTEADSEQVRTITNISGDLITLNSALPAVAPYEATGLLTYPPQDDDSERQSAFTYHDDSEWR